MQLFGFNATKCKTQCRLGVGRIKLLRNKKQIAMKQLRREVAELLRAGKQGNARIRVEAVMREDRMLKAYEILELYLELLAVRAELLSKTREIPPDMVEAICSLIYAGERIATDLAEIAAVAKQLVSKYSGVYKESGFPHEVVSDLTCRKWQVNESLVRCLAVTAPMPEEKLQFLESIAEEHDVEFDREKAAQDMLPGAPVASYAAPVQTIAAAGLSTQGPGQALPLAQGWQPPAAGVPPDAVPQAQPGWQPPPAGLPAGDAAAQEHYARVLSGGTVWHRAGEVGSPGATAQPSAADAAKPGGQGWQPPKPEDFDQPGRAFQSHVGAAAAWRQTKLHGPSPNTSGETPSLDYPPPAAGLADLPGTAQSSGGSTPSMSEKPPTPASTYVDATAAAEAAKQYSQLAAQAAQRAEQFAAAQAVRHGGGGSGGPSPGPSPGPGSPGPGSGGAGGGGGAADKGKGPSPFVERSFEEIQRAYDAAPGPPSKFDKMGGSAAPSAPPSAPPAADGAGTSAAGGSDGPATAGLGGTPDGEDGGLPDLPSVPAAGVPPPPGVGDELDELTRRFEALKRR